MSYTVIHGHFVFSETSNLRQLQRRRPSAGTLHFKPRAFGQRRLACEFGLQPNPTGTVEVRLEGVEALETQFMGRSQNLNLAEGARTRVLEALAVPSGYPAGREALPSHSLPSQGVPKQGVPRHSSSPPGPGIDTQRGAAPSHSTQASPTEGYLLARNVDRGGRLIAFAFGGPCDAPDGSQLFVEPKHVSGSVNAMLLREGWVYASCYDSLPSELRADLIELSRRARGKNLGLWPRALALPGRPLVLTSAESLDSTVMFPKLFRRLVEYANECPRNTHSFDMNGFRGWLRMNPHRDEMILLPNQEVGRLHDVIEVVGNQVRLTRNSEEFIVLKTSAAPLARSQRNAPDAPLRIIAAVVDPLDHDTDNKTVTLLNTTARSIGLESFSLRDRVGRALELQGDLGPGETRRFRLGHLLLGSERLSGWSLLNGDQIVDHVAFSPREGQPRGASLVF